MPLQRFTYRDYLELLKDSNKRITTLLHYYETFYREVIKLAEKAIRARETDQVLHYANILTQLDKKFEVLDNTTKKQIEKIILQEYKAGKIRGYLDLLSIRQKPEIKAFSIIDERKVQAAVFKTYRFLSTAISNSNKNIKDIINKIVEEQVALNVTTGRGMQISSIELTNKFKELGITKFKSPSGRHYDVKKYSEMVIRTETMTAHNDGNLIMFQEYNIDLVKISRHSTSCDFCKKYQGKIYSISGTHPKYPPLSSLPNGGPPFHPRCRHVAKPYLEDYD